MCFLIFHNEKHLCREDIKTRTSKSKKIDIFPKGEVHGFGGKLAIFPTYFLRQYIPGKMCFKILWNEKTNFQGYKIEKSKKSKNGPFSVQNWPFLNLSILGNIGRENVFYVIVEQNNNFLGYINKKLKKAKIDIFSKPMVLVQNWPFSHLFILAI